MKRIRLTAQVRQQIVASIRAGGYPHVAAEAWDIPKDVLADWLRRGLAENGREPYRSFAGEVRAAQAQARLKAELDVFKDDPKIWLEHGPGRETSHNPGWTVAVKPAESGADTRNALLDVELLSLFRALIELLSPYPDLRVQASQLFDARGLKAA